jgi:hypothetical protein
MSSTVIGQWTYSSSTPHQPAIRRITTTQRLLRQKRERRKVAIVAVLGKGGWVTEQIQTKKRTILFLFHGALLREIIYCKRAILSLSSSKILTPHPPLRLASVSYPPTKAGGTHSPGGEGTGGQYFGRRER